jgi:hypothetical protein
MPLTTPYDQLVPELKKPTYAALDDAAALALLKQQAVSRPLPISSKTMMQWLAAGGRYTRLQSIAADGNQSQELRSICQVALLMLARPDTTIDPSDPAQAAMIAALVSAGVATQTEADELAALAAEQVAPAWVAGLQVGNVTSARELIAQGK